MREETTYEDRPDREGTRHGSRRAKSKSGSKGSFTGKSRKASDRRSGGTKDSGNGVAQVNAANDPEWYLGNSQLINDVADFSFLDPIGEPLDYSQANYTPTYLNSKKGAIPGIYVAYVATTPGWARVASDPINQAVRAITTHVRSANSGAKNYDPADLGMYLLAIDSMYTYIAWLQRICGLCNLYSKTNYYMPEVTLDAMNVDRSVLLDPKALRAFVNSLITRVNRYNAPIDIPLFKRHTWLFTNIYTDSIAAKTQIYFYNPAHFYEIKEVASSQGTSLEPTHKLMSSATPWDLQDMITVGESMINALFNMETAAVISGDIGKAYGGKLWNFATIGDDYTTPIVYSNEVMNQLQNTNFIPGLDRDVTGDTYTSRFTITQDVNSLNIIFDPTANGTALAVAGKRLFDLSDRIPNPVNCIVASRNMAVCDATADTTISDYKYTNLIFGSELPIMYQVWRNYRDSNGVHSEKYVQGGSFMNCLAANVTQAKQYMENYIKITHALSKFKWHAPLYVEYLGDFVGVNYDTEMYCTVTKDNIKSMHQAALLSLLGVPNLGK